MATEVFAATSDGYVYKITGPSDYAGVTTATTGTGIDDTGLNPSCGQDAQYAAYQFCCAFDLSGVANIAAAKAATLSLYGTTITGSGYTVEARTFDWGASLDTSDYVTSAEFGGFTLLASKASSGLVTSAYNEFDSAAGLLSAVQAGGTLKMIIITDKFRTATQPGGNEYFQFQSADNTNKPKLTIVFAGGLHMVI